MLPIPIKDEIRMDNSQELRTNIELFNTGHCGVRVTPGYDHAQWKKFETRMTKIIEENDTNYRT